MPARAKTRSRGFGFADSPAPSGGRSTSAILQADTHSHGMDLYVRMVCGRLDREAKPRVAKTDQSVVNLRIVIVQPVIGVLHSLQAKDGTPLDPKRSRESEALSFDFQIRVGPGPKFFGDQVRPEGPVRRFVYIRIGQLAGDPSSPWSRRMKIDIHDIGQDLLDLAANERGVIETTIIGTDKDGTPACATVQPAARRIVKQ